MEEKKKSNVIYIIIILILLLAVGGLVYLIKTSDSLKCDCKDCDKQVKEDETKTYTYENISGKYEGYQKVEDIESPFDKVGEEFILYKNGTYVYNLYWDAAAGDVGNYIIEGNKIIMNVMYRTTSSTDTHIEYNKKRILTINDDDSLLDSDPETFDATGKKELVLQKTNDDFSGEKNMFDQVVFCNSHYSSDNEEFYKSCYENIKSAK